MDEAFQDFPNFVLQVLIQQVLGLENVSEHINQTGCCCLLLLAGVDQMADLNLEKINLCIKNNNH